MAQSKVKSQLHSSQVKPGQSVECRLNRVILSQAQRRAQQGQVQSVGQKGHCIPFQNKMNPDPMKSTAGSSAERTPNYFIQLITPCHNGNSR